MTYLEGEKLIQKKIFIFLRPVILSMITPIVFNVIVRMFNNVEIPIFCITLSHHPYDV